MAVPYFVYEIEDPHRSWAEVRSELLRAEDLAAGRFRIRFLAVFEDPERAEEFADTILPGKEPGA